MLRISVLAHLKYVPTILLQRQLSVLLQLTAQANRILQSILLYVNIELLEILFDNNEDLALDQQVSAQKSYPTQAIHVHIMPVLQAHVL